MGHGIVGLESNGLTKGCFRLARLALIRKEGAEWVRYAKKSGATIGTLRATGE